MFWAGIIGNCGKGPFFFKITLNGEGYLEFLINQLFNYLKRMPLHNRHNIWYLHDGINAYHNALIHGEVNK